MNGRVAGEAANLNGIATRTREAMGAKGKEKKHKKLRVWRHLMTKESGAGLEGTGSPDGSGGLIHDQHSTTSPKTMKASKSLED